MNPEISSTLGTIIGLAVLVCVRVGIALLLRHLSSGCTPFFGQNRRDR